MEVEVDVPNPDLSLIPGLYASAVVKVDRKEKALAVPVEAVSGQQHPTVFLIGKNGTVQERAIQLGLETPGKWEVLSGLKEHDLVMIGGRAEVRPGQKVTPKVVETLHAMK
jgi:multidrug efflux pump subunit AcrA (membrane-fusion protein)